MTIKFLASASASVLVLASVLIASPLPGQPEWNSGFDGERALKHVQVLAADSLRGRYSGFDGSDKANRYIAEHFDLLELEPPWGRDGYMHRFNYGAGEYFMPSSLTAFFPDGSTDTAHFWQDLNVFKYSGFGKAKGRLVFVGYGVSSPENDWDDYAGIDVKDAIVLAWRGVPPLENQDWHGWGMSGRKSSFALEKGAVGFIYCENNPPKWATISDDYFREELPAMWVSKSFADSLLKKTGKTKDQWKQYADSTKTPVSRPLDVEVAMQVSGKYYPKRKTQNIAGLWLGSDPMLRSEIVIIGAHMDHHGVDPAGNLYPGADDNASGTATMMELARVFVDNKVRTKRSIMFVGFAAEEEGLYGSKAFVKEMRLPKGMQVVAMLNMDMVGQGDCSLGVAGISEFPILGETMFAEWSDSALKQLEFWGLYDGSDHASFRDAGIPSYVIGARGDHPNYHTPGDSAGNVKPEVMKSVGDMMFHSALSLADYPQSMRPLVSRGQWLVNKYGGVRSQEMMIDEFETGVQSLAHGEKHSIRLNSGLTPYKQSVIRGVESSTPLVITTLQPVTPGRGWSSQYHRANEFVRQHYANQGINTLADSTRKDYLGEPFRGSVTGILHDCLPGDTLDLQALVRAGVGFVTTEHFGANPPMDSGYSAETDHHYPGWRGIATASRRAGIRLWINLSISNYYPIKMRSGQDYDEWWLSETGDKLAGVMKLAPLWESQIVCDATTNHELPAGELDSLLTTGCFLILNDLEFIKSHRGKADFAQLGIPSDPKFVEELLDQGFGEQEVGQLLFGNIQRTLQKWHADKSYRNP